MEMTLEEIYREMQDEVTEMAQVWDQAADAIERAQDETDPAKAVQKQAQISRAIHKHQAAQMGMISRQLLWIQRAMLDR